MGLSDFYTETGCKNSGRWLIGYSPQSFGFRFYCTQESTLQKSIADQIDNNFLSFLQITRVFKPLAFHPSDFLTSSLTHPPRLPPTHLAFRPPTSPSAHPPRLHTTSPVVKSLVLVPRPQCHVFAALEPDQPASAIVNFVTKVMIGSSSQRIYTN